MVASRVPPKPNENQTRTWTLSVGDRRAYQVDFGGSPLGGQQASQGGVTWTRHVTPLSPLGPVGDQ